MQLLLSAFTVALAGLFTACNGSSVLESDLFPFGEPEDTRFYFMDDEFTRYYFQGGFTFNFFNHTYNNIFISGNGQVSFGQGKSLPQFIKMAFRFLNLILGCCFFF